MTTDLFSRVAVRPWLYWLLVPIHRLLLSLFFRKIIIHGFEHLPVNGPLVLAPKHYSRWDALVLSLLSLEPFWFMTNANQFAGIQGWFIQRLGAFPVDLAHPKLSSFRYAADLLRSQKKLMLFPEGGIVRHQPLRSLKPGLAYLVQQAEGTNRSTPIPVVPVALRYEPDALFRAKVSIYISPPLYLADYKQSDKKQTALALTQALETALLQGLQELGVQ